VLSPAEGCRTDGPCHPTTGRVVPPLPAGLVSVGKTISGQYHQLGEPGSTPLRSPQHGQSWGSGAGTSALMETATLDYLTLLYVLHCPILS